MTTKVTIDAHAGWPVQVITLDGEHNFAKTAHVHIVSPRTQKDFYIHSGMNILSVTEMKSDITSVKELERPD